MSTLYYELCSITEQRVGTPIRAVTSVAFDTVEELLWTGLSSGHCVSYYPSYSFTNSQRYTAYITSPGEVRAILPSSRGIGSISRNTFQLHNKGGLRSAICSVESSKKLRTALYYNTANTEVIASSDASTIVLFDIDCEKAVNEVKVRHEITVMCRGRLLCCGGIVGSSISLLDPRTFRLENSLEVHNSGVLGLDVKGDLVVTCGLTKRVGQMYPVYDPLVRVFDVRTMRPLPPIPFPPGAYLLKFHPKFSSTLAVVSSAGQFSLCDAQSGGSGVPPLMRQINCGRDPVLSADISTSGDMLAFGDGGGYVHIWGTRKDANVNMYSRATENIPIPPSLPYSIGENTSLSVAPVVPLPIPLEEGEVVDSSYFSNWEPDSEVPVGSLVGIPGNLKEIMANLKRVGKVAIGTNPNPSVLKRTYTRDKLPINKTENKNENSKREMPEKAYRPPIPYRKTEIRLGKFGVLDFDFSRYNNTHFGALENILPNTYTNACLYMWYLIPQLRVHVLNHLCDKEFCLCCELAFLFHMMDIANGGSVHTTNFLRALRHMPHSASLQEPSTPNPTRMTYGTLSQRFNRFVLLQLRRELLRTAVPKHSSDTDESKTITTTTTTISNDEKRQQQKYLYSKEDARSKGRSSKRTVIDELFGAMFITVSTCRKCGNTRTRNTFTLDVDASFPKDEDINLASGSSSGGGGDISFGRMLDYSLVGQYDAPTRCVSCTTMQPHMHSFRIHKLPNVLSINMPITKKEYKNYWKRKHKDMDEIVPSSKPWIPSTLQFKLIGPDNRLQVIENPPPTETQNVYKLTSVVSHIHDGLVANISKQSHVVSHNLVSHEEYLPAKGIPPTWYLFNDFRISPTDSMDPIQFNTHWKIPCILCYSRVNIEEEWVSIPKTVSPITKDVFFGHYASSAPSLNLNIKNNTNNKNALKPLKLDELPVAGDVVAIDAEFVSLAPEVVRVRSDGTRVLVRPTQVSLARVSVVRGGNSWTKEPIPPKPVIVPLSSSTLENPQDQIAKVVRPARLEERKEGCGLYDDSSTAFIDSYIETKGPISDYLTRFSGIVPGDLTRGISAHHLTSLKNVYLQLRYLIDSGVIFIGHGLKKDFRIINILVPPHQVIDTVDLFRLEGQRMLSLRFLASYLLNIDIQKETHCSIEDSRTALALAQMYIRLVKMGKFSDVLEYLYLIGRKTNWVFKPVTVSPLPSPNKKRSSSEREKPDLHHTHSIELDFDYESTSFGTDTSREVVHNVVPIYLAKTQEANPYNSTPHHNPYANPHFYFHLKDNRWEL